MHTDNPILVTINNASARLDDRSHSLANLVLALGIPRIDTKIPTLCIELDVKTRRFLFHINPEFIKSEEVETLEQVGFLQAHEALHIALGHMEDTLSGEYDNAKALEYAHECIINDTLVDKFGPQCLPYNGCFGPKLFDNDFAGWTTRQAYDYIVSKMKSDEDQQQSNGDSSENGDDDNQSNNEQGSSNNAEQESPNSSGQGSSDTKEHSKSCGGIIIPDNATPQTLIDAVKDIIDQCDLQKDSGFESQSIGGGIGTQSGVISSIESQPLDIKWKDILQIINPKITSYGGKSKTHFDFFNQNPRIKSVAPNLIYPTRTSNNKNNGMSKGKLPTIVVAVDCSGSIHPLVLEQTINFVTNVPTELFNPIPIAFDSDIHEIDIDNPQLPIGGGTSIVGVYNYASEQAEKNKKKYQGTYVIVVSDGEYDEPECLFDKNPDWIKNNWFFIDCYNSNCYLFDIHDTGNFIDKTHEYNLRDLVNEHI
jgi:predicted metal-dependent peptidase